jgi:hypothetical protein
MPPTQVRCGQGGIWWTEQSWFWGTEYFSFSLLKKVILRKWKSLKFFSLSI